MSAPRRKNPPSRAGLRRVIDYLMAAGIFLACCYAGTRSLWFVAGIHWFWDFAWFYLGADGGASSAKLILTTLRQDRLTLQTWPDAALSVGLLLILLLVPSGKAAVFRTSERAKG